MGSTVINQDSLLIRISVSKELDITNLAPTESTISNFATLSPPAGMAQDFSEPVKYTVTAEDGTSSTYTVYITTDEPKIQVANSGFQHYSALPLLPAPTHSVLSINNYLLKV